MGHRILVIDDDQDIRDAIVEILEDAGHRTFAAANGNEALDKLRTEPDRPCLILLDLMMPVMDGRTFREEQLKDPAISQIPVVVLSAFRDAGETAKQLQAAAHLAKPITLEALIQLVDTFC